MPGEIGRRTHYPWRQNGLGFRGHLMRQQRLNQRVGLLSLQPAVLVIQLARGNQKAPQAGCSASAVVVFVAKHYLQSPLEPFTSAGKQFGDLPRSPGRAVKKLKTPSGRLAYSDVN